MDIDSLASLKQKYIAAMSNEMKTPVQMIVGLTEGSDSQSPETTAKVQDAAKYLLSLIDELSDFAQSKP